MSILIDLLPKTVNIRGLEYPINTDFRASILFEELMQDSEYNDSEKLNLAINLYFNHKVDQVDAINKILWFYRCGKEDKESKGTHTTASTNVYSFEYDAEYIYAAFLQQYGIDLQDVEYLHWWKFKAMFKSLTECKFVEIMGYRGMKIDDKMPKSQQKFYKHMKALYRLPDNRTEAQKEKAIVDSFASLF